MNLSCLYLQGLVWIQIRPSRYQITRHSQQVVFIARRHVQVSRQGAGNQINIELCFLCENRFQNSSFTDSFQICFFTVFFITMKIFFSDITPNCQWLSINLRFSWPTTRRVFTARFREVFLFYGDWPNKNSTTNRFSWWAKSWTN